MKATPITKNENSSHRWLKPLIVSIASLILVAVLAGGYWLGSRMVSEYRAGRARLAIVERRFDDARLILTKWKSQWPRDPEPYYLQAKIDVAEDHPKEALVSCEKAIELGIDIERIHVLQAIIFARSGNFERAEASLRKAFDGATGPEPDIDEALARVYLGTFRLVDAATVIDRWTKDAPEDARPYLWRIEVDGRRDVEPNILLQSYRAAILRDPNLIKARLGLANKLRELRRVEESEAEYEALLAIAPRSIEGLVGAGQNALQKGDIQAAIRYYEVALALDPNEPAALREMAIVDMRQNRPESARDRLATVVGLDPYDPEARYNYSQALRLTGETEKADAEQRINERLKKEHRRMSDLRKALVAKPDDLDLRNEAAQWLLEHGHEQEGLEWTTLILKETPGHKPTCRLLADYYQKKGNAGLANFYKIAAGESEEKGR